MRNLPELLAPAGGRRALEAAIEGGADAVYLGAGQFNARMRAENFTDDVLRDSLSLCKSYGVKTYLTLNTRLFDNELYDALKVAANVYEMGADALIVADMGLATLIKQNIPDFEIHASTQLSGHSTADAEMLCAAGFSRMVCQREITLEELKRLCKSSPVDIEMFIHGAHCVSFSGQCLMSAVMGGRSGNRGECAQPCRQQYYQNGRKCYPLSLKDMCLAGHITDIIEAGAASLKIEGRQKSAEYVLGVTRIYRRLLDERRNATEAEIAELDSLFSRDGFSDGYLTSNHKNMLGVRTLEDYQRSDIEEFQGITKKVPLSAKLRIREGEAPSLLVSASGKSVSVTGEIFKGDIAPLSYEGALKNMSRLGNTPYCLESFDFDTDGKAPVPLSAVNALRRLAIEALSKTERRMPEVSVPVYPKKKGEVKYIAEFTDVSQISDEAREFFDEIYLPYGAENEEYGVSLPPYMTDEVIDRITHPLGDGKNLLVHSASGILLAEKLGMKATLSLRGNVFNSAAAAYYESLGACAVIFAPEVRLAKIRDARCNIPIGAVVYGRLPLMLTVRCAISDGGAKCKNKTRAVCKSSLQDRRRAEFPVFGMPDCTNVIYNSVPIYMADKKDEIDKAAVCVREFIFTTETAKEVTEIIKAYKTGAAPKGADIRRMV